VYEKFIQLKPKILKRIDRALENYAKSETSDKKFPLNNIRRSVIYHFESQEIKDLILSNDEDKSELTMHNITRIPLYVHMLSAICCLLFSSFFHLFSCCNENANNYFSRLDYSGISFLIAGS